MKAIVIVLFGHYVTTFCLYAVSELFLAIVSGSEPVVLRCHLPRDTSRWQGVDSRLSANAASRNASKGLPGFEYRIFPSYPFPFLWTFPDITGACRNPERIIGCWLYSFPYSWLYAAFISAVERVLRIDFKLDEAQLGNRVVRTDALPMGINYGLYHNASSRPEVRRAIDRTRKFSGIISWFFL